MIPLRLTTHSLNPDNYLVLQRGMLQATHESYTGFSAFNTVDRDSTDTEWLLQRNTGQQGPLYVTSQSQETIPQWKEALSSHYGVSVRLHRIPYSFNCG